MLKPERDIEKFKLKVYTKFWSLQNENPLFNNFISNIRKDHQIYIVGGFLRDTINKFQSRDIDMVFDIGQEELFSALSDSGLAYKINRMFGAKVELKDFEADIWTIKNNWAFKSKVIKKNDDRILDSIADGCFFNYDSLVLNVNSGNARIKNYNDCVISKKLDILKKSDVYKERNPTGEANILRALYIKKLFNIEFSDNCLYYLARKVLKIDSNLDEASKKINLVKNKYPKYQLNLDDRDVNTSLSEILKAFDTLNKKGFDESQISLHLDEDDM